MDHIKSLVNRRVNVESQLKPFLFPVEERAVAFEDYPNEFFAESTLIKTDKYKSIVRSDNNRLISIMPNTYKVVSNKEVVLPVIDFLDRFDNKWVVDPSHSFVQDGRMRLQITFPELIVNDGESDIALSLFIHNSYNGMEGVRGFWGGIRGICTNGMVFGKLLGSFYSKHTSGINLDKFQTQLEETTSKLPIIEERINILRNIEVNSKMLEDVEHKLGKTAMDYVNSNFDPTQSQYILLNVLTHYVSHNLRRHVRANYQRQISNIFNI